MGDDVPPDDRHVVFTNTTLDGKKLRPSNWTTRLDDMVAAHSRGRRYRFRCRPCARCAARVCFVLSVRTVEEAPGLAADLLFFLQLAGAAEVADADCPRFAVVAHADLGREHARQHLDAA
ncbi:MAG TPA: hypothetical protein VKA14_10110 [Gammaproteobacteria bacterium]|nr:hypothetical protein [Gammaproteobacteria bacterium]